MLKNKYLKWVCLILILVAGITVIVILIKQNSHEAQDEVQNEGKSMLYETKLFNTDVVHTIDIQINQADWDSIQADASAKEYEKCDIVIDGNQFSNAAIRAKGNSSLSQVQKEGSERYSLKIEFDHYEEGSTCWGLDKLSLNNIIQDSTYIKDYLSYTLMREMGADAPLCSYIFVKVNGEDFGLYLAVEGIEESFLQRNYSTDSGNLYKPETADMIANMGNDNMKNRDQKTDAKKDAIEIPDSVLRYGYDKGQDMPGRAYFNRYNVNNVPGGGNAFGGWKKGDNAKDVALSYIDDEISSYSNIFDQAITEVSDKDKKTLISSIKQMNAGENLEEVLNTNEILSYFIVHNFVDNYDSYTGTMLHNYYLYENNGKIDIIAWDYNLAFGGFNMGQGRGMNNITQTDSTTDEATKYVNYPIDTPVSGTTMEDRPLLNCLLSNEEYLKQYHELFDDFISTYFKSGYVDKLIDRVSMMIMPYIEKDKTAFYTKKEFDKGIVALKKFCELRAESIRGQLDGTIPSTTLGQTNSEALIDASSINITDMGGAGGMDGKGGGNQWQNK